jgi:hypothetical protein
MGTQTSPSKREPPPPPEYLHQTVLAIKREESNMDRSPKLDLEKKMNLFMRIRFLASLIGEWKTHRLFSAALRVDVNYKYIDRL